MEIRHFCGALFVVCLCGNGMSFPAEHKEQHSSCETAETVHEGHRATISCRFSRPFENFLVYKLPSSDGSKKTIPVVCNWEKGKRNCNILDGYNVTTTATRDRATVTIPLAQQKHSGEYYCKTLPAATDNATSCILTVQKHTVRNQTLVACNTSRPVAIGKEASLTCAFSKSVVGTGITLIKQGLRSVEIMRCDKNQQCEMQTEGYAIAEQTDTYIRISIPSATRAHTGVYECSSAIIKEISGRCLLELTTGPLEEHNHPKPYDKESPYSLVMIGVFGTLATVTLAIALIVMHRYFAFGRRPGCLTAIKTRMNECVGDSNRASSPESNDPCLPGGSS
ncbi:uncharacterized protein [Littorina saxatilis]|uniref:uncharacterized protein n=1 Tax=Littorina saxatilis TaxID=31220 RepID=UPI0038B65E19